MSTKANNPNSEKKFKVVFNNTKKDILTESGQSFSKFVNTHIRTYANTVLIKNDLKLDKLKQFNLFIIGGPRNFFSGEEVEVLKAYLEEGGSILVLQGEGGDDKTNSNINAFIENYGILFHGDSVVRTSYFKYFHPKECYIDTCKVHPEFLRSIKNTSKKKRIDLLENDEDQEDDDDTPIKLVYPYGQSLDVAQTTSVIFNSGIISYPVNRPLCACSLSQSRKGKLAVLGSIRFIDNDFIDKEENKKVIEGLIKWLLGICNPSIDKPSKEVEISEYIYIPNIISLSDKVKSCLEDVKEPPRNFNDLFDMGLYKIDNNLVPEALELYDKLNVKHETLTIIPPQFDTPLPPLQLAVFDPIIKDFSSPALELFDLDEQFASEKIKLAQVTNKCNDEDLEYYIKECSDILGITGKLENKSDPKAILYFVFKQLINFKKLNP